MSTFDECRLVLIQIPIDVAGADGQVLPVKVGGITKGERLIAQTANAIEVFVHCGCIATSRPEELLLRPL